jgi:LuxR family maltose regulon positive regulatory protein
VHGVLRSRLLPPQLPAACVPRTALVGRVLDRIDGRLVTIVAGAGYGKTTLLRLTVDRLDWPWVWCSCDERIGDGGLLLRHLTAGFAERYPGFGARLSLTGSPRDQVEEFCNEVVETVGEDVVVMLDDVHLLPEPTLEALDGLLRDLPGVTHLVLAGREPMPLGLGRLRAGRMLEIGEGELAFTREESESLLEAVGVTVDPQELRTLHREVEGWVAGLIMVAQAGGDEGGAQLEYLAEEVLSRQPPDVQRFLLASSVLDRFTPAVAAAVTERDDAGELARSLVERHLFTVRLEGGAESYRYHHLFQAFLRERLAEAVEPGLVAELHRRAALALLADGEHIDAVPHLLAAGDHEGAADALEPVAENLVTTPHAQTLVGWLDAMPRESWDERPSLMTAHAALLLIRGEHEASFDEFERAIDRLLGLGDHERAAAALLRLLQSMITAGTRPGRRVEAGERYIGRISPKARALPSARILLASSYAYACDFERAARELHEALALPGAEGQPMLRVYADIVQAYYVRAQVGHIEEAVLALDEAIADLERHEEDDELAFMPYARMFRVYLLNDLGLHDDAFQEITRTQDAATRRGMARTHRRVVAWIRGVALAGSERWDELEREIAPPERAPGRHEPTSYSYRYRAIAAQLAAVRGEAVAVRSHVAAAREEMAAFGPAFDKPMVLCDLARAALRAGDGALALDVAAEARRIARDIDAPWGLARACMHAAVGDGAAADDALAEALRLTERWSLSALWRDRERALAGRLLARAMTRGLGPPGLAARTAATCGAEVFRECVELTEESPAPVRAQLAEVAGDAANVEASVVERLLRDRDPTVRAAARRARAHLDARPRPAIRLLTLGRFSVARGGVPVPEAAFGRQRARALLGVLLSVRGPVHREQLADWLWPQTPPERAFAGLRVALHGLRRGLAPELEANAPGSPVLADGETVRLALDEDDEWDVESFLELVRRRSPDAEEEIRCLERAEALYAGPFLPEWPYADWAAPARRELEERRREALERLAAALADAGRVLEAIRRYRRLVSLEPEREAWHRALMSCYASTGERAQALRQFHACRTILRREQGVAPGPETSALYREILAETDA